MHHFISGNEAYIEKQQTERIVGKNSREIHEKTQNTQKNNQEMELLLHYVTERTILLLERHARMRRYRKRIMDGIIMSMKVENCVCL